jgi:preprotein translocase subunit SecF
MFEILAWKKNDWDFVNKRRIAFALSGILVATGLAAIVQLSRGRAAMGIDFAGGLVVNTYLEQKVDLDRVRAAFEARGIADAQIQQVDSEKGQKLLVKLRGAAATGTLAAGSGDLVVRSVLQSVSNGATVLIEGSQEVGPAVGKSLQVDAAWAVFWAIVLIMLYIWVRFDYQSGVAAAIATLHDVIVVLGIMWVLHKDFTLLIVTALLTLAGYSLTDTVVVFDRIRDNKRHFARDPLEVVINRSINEVLSRTLVTSVMVVLPLAALLVYGSPVTYDFALALMIGVVVGTYSSWFVASPILVEWEVWRRARAAAAALRR